MKMISSLLPEILEVLFNHCATKDLKNLSLTDSMHNELLKEHLFRRVIVPEHMRTERSVKNINDVADGLQSLAPLCEHIRCLSIHYPLPREDWQMATREMWTQGLPMGFHQLLASFRQLEELRLEYVSFGEDVDFQVLVDSLTNLKVLTFCNMRLDDGLCDLICGLPKLETLVIICMLGGIYGYDMEHTMDKISTSKTLRSLRIVDPTGSITEEAFEHLCRMPLRKLECGKWQTRKSKGIYTYETNFAFSKLHMITTLEEFTLSNTTYDSRSGDDILHNVAMCGSLRVLKIHRCQKPVFSHIGHMEMLERLSVNFCLGFDDIALHDVSRLPRLKYLDVSNSARITDIGIGHVSQSSTLQTLILSDCSQITSACLSLVGGMESLRMLDVRGCTQVDGKPWMLGKRIDILFIDNRQ
jgi:hypothetical protein